MGEPGVTAELPPPGFFEPLYGGPRVCGACDLKARRKQAEQEDRELVAVRVDEVRVNVFENGRPVIQYRPLPRRCICDT